MADEEAGGIHGAYQLVKNRWDLVGAEYLLTEVAYPQVLSGSEEPIPVAVAEKGSHFSRLTTTGVPGHGSAPYGADNALEKLIQALDNLNRSTSPVSVGEVWSEFVGEIGLDPGLAEALLNPAAVDEAIESIAVDDPLFARYVHAATHLTTAPNAAGGGWLEGECHSR